TDDTTHDENGQPPDAYPVWLTLDSGAARTCVIRDGKAVLACRTAAAIHSYGTFNIERNHIKGCLGPAIHVTASMGAVPGGGANGSRIERNRIKTATGKTDPSGRPWGGVGIAIYGGDASAILLLGNYVTGSDNEHNEVRGMARMVYNTGDRA